MGFLSGMAKSLGSAALSKRAAGKGGAQYGGPFTMNQGAEQAGRMHELAMRDPKQDAIRRSNLSMEQMRPSHERNMRTASATFGRRLGTGGSMGASGGARTLASEQFQDYYRQGGMNSMIAQQQAEAARDGMLRTAMGYTNDSAKAYAGQANAQRGMGSQIMNAGIMQAVDQGIHGIRERRPGTDEYRARQMVLGDQRNAAHAQAMAPKMLDANYQNALAQTEALRSGYGLGVPRTAAATAQVQRPGARPPWAGYLDFSNIRSKRSV